MKNKIINELKFLFNEIKKNDQLYHQNDISEITDYEFDKICEKYDKLVKKYPNLGFKERTSVGFKSLSQFNKILSF